MVNRWMGVGLFSAGVVKGDMVLFYDDYSGCVVLA